MADVVDILTRETLCPGGNRIVRNGYCGSWTCRPCVIANYGPGVFDPPGRCESGNFTPPGSKVCRETSCRPCIEAIYGKGGKCPTGNTVSPGRMRCAEACCRPCGDGWTLGEEGGR